MEYSSLLIDLLYQMAFVDGRFDPAEKEFISSVIEEQGMTADQLSEKSVGIPPEERDRMTILYYLLFLIKIDGKVEPSERNFAYKFGVLLGFRPEMIGRMLDAMESHLDEKLPDDELISIVKQYLN